MEFMNRLNEALKERDMTAAELARISGVNEGAISQYRKGKYKPAQSNLDRLAHALNVPIPWLMGNDIESPFQNKLTEKEKIILDKIRKLKDISVLETYIDFLITQQNKEEW